MPVNLPLVATSVRLCLPNAKMVLIFICLSKDSFSRLQHWYLSRRGRFLPLHLPCQHFRSSLSATSSSNPQEEFCLYEQDLLPGCPVATIPRANEGTNWVMRGSGSHNIDRLFIVSDMNSHCHCLIFRYLSVSDPNSCKVTESLCTLPVNMGQPHQLTCLCH